MYPFFHVNRTTFGTYECRVMDKYGNTASSFSEVTPEIKVRAKVLEWDAEKVSEDCNSDLMFYRPDLIVVYFLHQQ